MIVLKLSLSSIIILKIFDGVLGLCNLRENLEVSKNREFMKIHLLSKIIKDRKINVQTLSSLYLLF